jgi:hypothetical protein
MDKLNITIDGPKALELLWFAVAERGTDYVYAQSPGFDMCSYVDANREAPGCGVGLALHKAGVPVSDLRGFDNEGAIHCVASSSRARSIGLEMTASAVEIFTTFQEIQDEENSWGLALHDAVRVASKQTEV